MPKDLAIHTMPALAVTGITGAVTPTRLVGGTASGAPVSGTFITNDVAVAANGSIYICTAGGTPGTWAAVSGGGGSAYDEGLLMMGGF